MTTSLLPAPDARRREAEQETLDAGGQLRLLWKNRPIVLGCAALGGVLALAVSFLAPRTYTAEAAMAVSRSKLGEERSTADALSTANFRPLIESAAIADRVIKANGLDKAPYYASPTTFYDRLIEIEEIRNSQVIKIHGYLNDPALVATVVNQVGHLASDAARRLSQQEALQARDDIKLQLDEAKTHLDGSSAALERARVSSQIELVRSDVQSALSQRDGLLDLSIDIASERARLAKAEEELKKRQPVDTIHRTIDSSPALTEAVRSANTKPSDLLGLQLKTEEVNPVYQDIDRQIADSRARLAGLEDKKKQIDGRKLDAAQLAKLNELYAKETTLAQLELERDLARKTYQDVATSYESARLLVAGRSSALQLINAAIPPDKPMSRHAARNVLIGTLSGFVLAALILLIYAAAGGPERRPAAIRM